MIPPDLKQNIIYMVYFTVIHNAPAFLYAGGVLAGAVLSILKPSRTSVLLLLGSLLLLFGFEYNKHIVEGLREQTLTSLITIQEHNMVRRLVNILTLKLLPIFFPVAGWCLVGAAALMYMRSRTDGFDKRKEKDYSKEV